MSWYESSGDELVLSAVLRQLPGLPAAVVEEHVTPHVPKMAERLFRRNRKEKVRNLFENNVSFLGDNFTNGVLFKKLGFDYTVRLRSQECNIDVRQRQ
jgi:hypothetical protein